MTAWGKGFTVTVTSSFNVDEQLLSLIFVKVYVVVKFGSTINVSFVLYYVTERGDVATL